MSAEHTPSNDGSYLPPEIIAELEEIEQDIRDPETFTTLEKQVFFEYYKELPERLIGSVRGAYISFEVGGAEHLLNPVGNTQYGPLYELTSPISTDKRYVVLAGTMVFMGDISQMDEVRYATIQDLVCRDAAEDVAILSGVSGDETKYMLFTRGLCVDGYLVLLPALKPSELEPDNTMIDDTGYIEQGDFSFCSVLLTNQDEPTPLLISKQPAFTSEKIQQYFITKHLTNGMIERDEIS